MKLNPFEVGRLGHPGQDAVGVKHFRARPKVGGHFIDRAHKASFVVWFVVLAIHVLGHILETPALAVADWRRSTRGQTAGVTARLTLLASTTAFGIALAFLSLSWVHKGH